MKNTLRGQVVGMRMRWTGPGGRTGEKDYHREGGSRGHWDMRKGKTEAHMGRQPEA